MNSEAAASVIPALCMSGTPRARKNSARSLSSGAPPTSSAESDASVAITSSSTARCEVAVLEDGVSASMRGPPRRGSGVAVRMSRRQRSSIHGTVEVNDGRKQSMARTMAVGSASPLVVGRQTSR